MQVTSQTEPGPRLSVVLPCLNEGRTVAECVREALAGAAALGCDVEVLCIDNGSTDDTARAAAEAGARVLDERRRGYGSAVARGIAEARGEIIVMGDADGSYRFDRLGPLLEKIDAGGDLVMGSRLKGTIEAGAMPWLHRHLGTPVLTFLVNRFFGTHISDVNCGQRALRRSAAQALDLRAGGMEFASEMVVKAALAGQRIEEVPVDFRRDRRDRPPHLRTWRDGWRHLRFILLFQPNIVLIGPGLALLVVGAVLGGPAFLGRAGFGGAAAFAGAALVLLGAQLMHVGVLVKTWYHVEGFNRRPYLDRLFGVVRIEAGLALAAVLIAFGVVLGVPLVADWREGAQVEAAQVAACLTFLVLGMQVVASSVILSVLGIRRG